MKTQIKLIACLVSAALLLSSSAAFVRPIRAQNIRPLAASQDSDVPLRSATVQGRSQDPELTKHFRRYDVVKFDRDAATRQVKNRGRMILETSHGNFDLEFSPYDLRSSDYSAQEIGVDGTTHTLPKAPVNTFKASVKDNPRAQARMSVGADGLEGAIIIGTEKYFIQPARTLSKTAQSDEFVFYSVADVTETDAECGVTLADEVAQAESQAAEADVAAALNPINPISPMAIARIATDADGEYVNGLGGSAAAGDRILQIMNVVDGIYQVEVGVTFQIVFQNFWTDQNADPYTQTEAADRLNQFRNHWNGRQDGGFGTARSLAHLWTGIDLDGSTIGIASLAPVCRNPNFAYGLSQRFPLTGLSDARTVLLTAHEIGHNFAANHTNVIGRDIPAEFSISCDNTIMESGLGTRTGSSFCAFSRSQIVGHATANSSCLLNAGTPPPANNCAETPITSQVPINASLAASDCRSPSRGNPHFADLYTFNGTAGQQVTISMSQPTGGLDPYLYLISPDGFIVDQADFGGGGTNAQIPEVSDQGVFTLPQTGKYIVEATSLAPGQTGGYQIMLNVPGCSLSTNLSAYNFPAAGGTATLNISVSGNCFSYRIVSDPNTIGNANWISLFEGGGSGPRSIGFNVSANTGSIGRRSFILIAPSGGNSINGGLRIPVTQSGTGPDCSVSPISIGQTLNGNLANTDCESQIRNTASVLADRYTFAASAGQQFAISLQASTFNTFLTLIGPNGAVLLNDDNSGGGQNSRIPGGTGMLTAGLPGTYTIEVGSLTPGQTGAYSLSLTGTAPDWQPTVLDPSQVELKSWKVDGRTFVYAKLTFPTTGYRVANWNMPAQSGNDFSVDATIEKLVNGVAALMVTSNAQIWDLGALADGNYSFTFKNSGTNVKTLNFTVSSTPPAPNPIDDARTFVFWQYRDFLRRDPDGPGWDHWTAEITQCSNAAFRRPGESEAQCVERKRENTSAAFFVSPESQNIAYFVLRVYRGSLGRMPFFGGGSGAGDEFTRDAATVGQGIVVNNALDHNRINTNKQAFVNAFVARSDFRAIYDPLNNTQYVDQLFQTTGVTPSAGDRQALINGLNATTETRASVLFKVVDGTTTGVGGILTFNTVYGKAFYDNQFNAGFVQMEYFGYLQRDPDPGGYAFWLGKLNTFGDWVNAEMVRSFIKAPEYRARFGAP